MAKLSNDVRLQIAHEVQSNVWETKDILKAIEFKVEAREMNESVKAQFMRLPGLPTHGSIATPSANPNNSTVSALVKHWWHQDVMCLLW